MATLLMLVGAVVIIVLATWISWIKDSEIRAFGIIAIGALTYILARNYDDLLAAFFTNVSTELLGALITASLLGAWVKSSRWSFAVIVTIVLCSILFVEGMEEYQAFMLNMSTELLGAFLVFLLINREWFWGIDPKTERENVRKKRNPYR